jgi:[acyl-carrier-protein] S-malonyltransferase
MSRLAILCPGQGAQHRAMFELARQDAAVAEQMRHWSLGDRFEMPLDRLLADPTTLFANRIAQPLIVAATLAAWAAVKKMLPRPALVAGYSIGELSAYGVAGAITAIDAITLATARARLMDRCAAPDAPQSLLSVTGLPAATVTAMLRQYDLHVAIEVGETSIIVGGLSRSFLPFGAAVASLGGTVNLLPVGVASHTPLMRAALEDFGGLLERCNFTDPKIAVLSGVRAEPVRRQQQARTDLAQQLVQTIRWKDCMDRCVEQGITIALELGPGSALARMLHNRHSHIVCRSLQDFRSLEGVAAWIERHAH